MTAAHSVKFALPQDANRDLQVRKSAVVVAVSCGCYDCGWLLKKNASLLKKRSEGFFKLRDSYPRLRVGGVVLPLGITMVNTRLVIDAASCRKVR